VGKETLFYANDGTRLLFGSEIKALLAYAASTGGSIPKPSTST